MKNLLAFLILSADCMARLLKFAVKVAVAVLVACLLLSLFSCSSARSVATESVASDSISVAVASRDSVASRLQMQSSDSGYLDIQDLTITFYPSIPCHAVNVPDSVAGVLPSASPSPAMVTIGHLSAGKRLDASLTVAKDSVASAMSDLTHDSSAESSGTHIRSHAPRVWPVCLVFGFAVAMIAFIIYRFRHDFKA